VCKTLATTTRRRNEIKDGINSIIKKKKKKETLAGYHSDDGPYREGEFPFPLSSYANVRACQTKLNNKKQCALFVVFLSKTVVLVFLLFCKIKTCLALNLTCRVILAML